ncbi:MAG: DUF58 domain-containing protein [Cyclobacteriaceae bacterium]
METAELLKKVRQVEIATKGVSKNIFAGEYQSAFKGRGMAFSEVREYQPGDDVRAIDWKVTARFSHPYIKVFEEERELTIMLLIDVSASESFGTRKQFKKDLVTEIAAVLAFSAIQNNDKIGVLFFSDQVEKFIPPKKGKKHVLRIIRELIEFEPVSKKTNIAQGVTYFTNMIKKHATAFVISDFIDEDYESALRFANSKHDLMAIKVYDKGELELPKAGLLQMVNQETGAKKWINTNSKKVRDEYAKQMEDQRAYFKKAVGKCGIDMAEIATDESYVKPLVTLFKKRS